MRHLHDPNAQYFFLDHPSDVMPTHLDSELVGTYYRID